MNAGDQLIYVLSARGELSWPVFKTIFDSLIQSSHAVMEDVPILRNRVLRLLDSFGYCDFTFRKGIGSIFVCPATLARFPLLECAGLLVGARAPSTLSTLEKIAKTLGDITISVDETDDALFIPSRVTVRSSDPETLNSFCHAAGLPIEIDPPCWKLASFSADVESYIASLQWAEGSELNWKAWQFDPEYCEFRSEKSNSTCLRLVRYLDPIKNTPRYRLWDGTRHADVDVDWGRYIVLRESGFNVLFYDPRQHLLAVPRNAYLPRLLQRSLGLCSGLMPVTYRSSMHSENDRKALDLFQWVPSKIAETVSQKLGQSLSHCHLN
jgi:hypothetical protein